MATINIWDGLVLTVVSMIAVFAALIIIWGLVELTSKIIAKSEQTNQLATETNSPQLKPVPSANTNALAINKKNKKAAEIIALVLASEDQPDKKFEIIESKRVK